MGQVDTVDSGHGFASVLKDIGLPQGDLGMALLFFNVGVEIGQVMFVGAVVATFMLLKRVQQFPLAQAQTMITGTLAEARAAERTVPQPRMVMRLVRTDGSGHYAWELMPGPWAGAVWGVGSACLGLAAGVLITRWIRGASDGGGE